MNIRDAEGKRRPHNALRNKWNRVLGGNNYVRIFYGLQKIESQKNQCKVCGAF